MGQKNDGKIYDCQHDIHFSHRLIALRMIGDLDLFARSGLVTASRAHQLKTDMSLLAHSVDRSERTPANLRYIRRMARIAGS